MAQVGTRELKNFVYGSLRSRLALDMLALCLRRNATYVSVADFATALRTKPGDVARTLIDWVRQGLFRPTSSGKYCFAPGPGHLPLIEMLRKILDVEQGRRGLSLWVGLIQKKLVSSAEELPALAVLRESEAAAEVAKPAEQPQTRAAEKASGPAARQAPAPAPASPPSQAQPSSQPGAQPLPAPRSQLPAGADGQQAYTPVSSGDLDAATVKAIRRYVQAIPPLPIVAQQLLREIGNPSSSAKSLASIAIKDPAIVLSLLRMANSAFYGQGETVTDVQRAIVVIGLNNIKHLIMVSGLQTIFKQPRGARGYSFEALWAHALGVSVAARLLVRKVPVMGEAEAGTIGLLHDIGKFAMAVAHPKLTEELIDPFQGPEGLTGIAKEVALFGSTHAIYGMMLLESWKLPNEFARIVEYHHHPAYAAKQGLPQEILRGLALVHVANQLAKLGGLECGDHEIEAVPDYCYELLGLSEKLETLLDERMQQTFDQVKFFVAGGAKPAAGKGAPGKPGGGAPGRKA